MFTRSRKKISALIALFAVIFAALMPATSAFARTLSTDHVVALSSICTTHDASGSAPVAPTAINGHCAFCTMGAPLVSAPRVDALLVTLGALASVPQVHRNDALPRDVVAIHPLLPRAPPRAI
jgi:hypothetical protein